MNDDESAAAASPTTGATLLERTFCYEGRLLRVAEERIELPDGRRTTLEMIRHPGAAAIVAVDEHERVLLVRQFRHAAGGWIHELPAGTLDAGEAPLSCARRELVEETGYRAEHFEELGFVWTTPGFTDEKIYLYLASGLSQEDQALDDDELLEVVEVPFVEAFAMVLDGRISDAKSIAALTRAKEHLGQRRAGLSSS